MSLNSTNPNIKTAICKYAFIGCKQQHNCWYAHNKDELRQRYCINNNCTNTNCIYLHPGTTVDKDLYFLKVLQKSDVLGIDKNKVANQLDIISSKFIIEIDNDDIDSDESEINDNDAICNKDINSDNPLQQYILNFTQQWQQDSKQFYQMIENKHKLTLTMKVDDIQMQMISHILSTMKIEFNIDQLIKNQ